MPERTRRFFEGRLQRYFDMYYKSYEETAEFYANPDINQWRFIIPELGLEISLTCNSNGQVVEKRRRV